MDTPETNDEIIHVPVPKHLLPAVYRLLADGMTSASTHAISMIPVPLAESYVARRNMIDLIVDSAGQIGAARQPVSLTDLYTAYRQAYPDIGKGITRGSFDATVNFYCINMRSRFPNKNVPRKHASWLSQPVFKRVARARYMLLSPDEVARFRYAIAHDNPLIYQDEFDVADLAPVE